MFRSGTRFGWEFSLVTAFLFLTASTIGAADARAAVSAEPDVSILTMCQAETPDNETPGNTDSQAEQTDPAKAEEEESDFFLWLNDAFSTSAGSPTKKPSNPARDRDNDKDHGGGGGGGGGH